MIRRLLVVLAIVFAVAAGIALGAGPLSTAQAPLVAPTEQPQPVEQPAADPRAAYADSFIAAVAGRLYTGDELAGRTVALVRLPGVPDDQVTAIVEQVGLTGAEVVSEYAVGGPLLDPSQRSLVDTLGSQLAEQLGSTTVPADATAYTRIGALLGGVVASHQRKGDDPAADASTIEQSLSSADLLKVSRTAERRSPLVLVLLGDEPGETADPAVGGLVAGLAGSARAVVVAGPAPAASEGGVLARLRAEDLAPQVTTVDGIDGPAGRVTVALALTRSFTEPGGHFGAAGADGPVPMR